MAILVAGGAGYIGSHTVVELDKAGYEVVILDDFSNSSPEVLKRLTTITGKEFPFYEGSILDHDFCRFQSSRRICSQTVRILS